MTLLEVKNLAFSHSADTGATYNFDLQLDAGKILAVGGKSGSGKSTLLDLIAGFLKPARGHIILNDRDITHLPPFRRQISILFQKNNLFEHMSVLENTCLGLNPNSSPTPMQKLAAAQMLARVGLNNFENHRANTLSGGQMQRAALARELLRDSRLILLDEPFNGLDEEARDMMLPLLKLAVETGERSIILVTHDLQGVGGITNRTGEVRGGHFHLL